MKSKKLITTLLSLTILSFCAINALACEVKECPEGMYWSDEFHTCKPIIKGGASFLNFLPKVAWVDVKNGVVSWLFSKFSHASLICDETSHNYPLNVYGQPTDGTPENSLLANLGENYGYKYLIDGNEGEWTYNTIELPNWFSGTYYCRTINTVMGLDILSNEFILVK